MGVVPRGALPPPERPEGVRCTCLRAAEQRTPFLVGSAQRTNIFAVLE